MEVNSVRWKSGRSLKLTIKLPVSLCVRQPHYWLIVAVFVNIVTERNVCMQFVGELHSSDGTAVRCVIAQCLVCYCECGSPSVPITAVSWMLSVSTQVFHASVYRSKYSLLTWSCLDTLQGILVCYSEFDRDFCCFRVNVAVRLFQLLLSAESCQFQHRHFMLHSTDACTVCC